VVSKPQSRLLVITGIEMKIEFCDYYTFIFEAITLTDLLHRRHVIKSERYHKDQQAGNHAKFPVETYYKFSYSTQKITQIIIDTGQ
jgi:hypothetical protein